MQYVMLFFYRQKNVAVLGNGEYAVSEATELLPIAKTVTILTNGKDPIEMRSGNVKCNVKEIEEFRGGETIQEVRFKDNSIMEVDGVFIAEGIASSVDLARKIGVQVKEDTIVVDGEMQTTLPGLYAAGDCTGGLLQISKAVYEGAQAGLSAIKYIRTQSNTEKDK